VSQQQYLQAMGIDVWQRRELLSVEVVEQSVIAPQNSEPESSPAVADNKPAKRIVIDVAAMGWEALQGAVSACDQCSLHTSRTQTVFGIGNQQASLLIIGEAPGADEDRQGEPFVGRAGQLLNEMLRAIGFKREQVYIANILKCRPPNNRDPQADEVTCCERYLQRQIALIQPAAILAVGRIAAQNLLRTDERIGALRGRVHQYAETEIPLIATYHPAYLLRSPSEKRKSWEDLKKVRATISNNKKHGSLADS